MLKYRVILKVGYCDAWFDFDKHEEACEFASTALAHQCVNEDNEKKTPYIQMRVIDTELEAQRKKEEEKDE